MNIIFLMDPLEGVIMEKDTSFILMWGAYQRKHNVYFLPSGGIVRQNGKTVFRVIEVIPQKKSKKPFIIKNAITLSQQEVDAIFIRKDPPFNSEYLWDTWLLDLLPKHIKIINNPKAVRSVNEKLWVTQFTDLHPPTLISRDKQDMLDFIEKEQQVVAKPTDGFGGQSIFYIQTGDKNLNVILETLTQYGQKDIILQKFLPESTLGDKRILLLNAQPLGAVLRVHAPNDHRNNFFAGGTPQATSITAQDQRIIQTLKPYLQKLGLYFVGIDIMGDYLIELNVTSPTGLQEMNRLYGTNLEKNVIQFMEEL